MKFRKKPIVIEAIQYDGIESVNEMRSKWPDFYKSSENSFKSEISDYVLLIETLEGIHTAHRGDWIIKGIKGEFYPCKSNVFEMTYEKVEE